TILYKKAHGTSYKSIISSAASAAKNHVHVNISEYYNTTLSWKRNFWFGSLYVCDAKCTGNASTRSWTSQRTDGWMAPGDVPARSCPVMCVSITVTVMRALFGSNTFSLERDEIHRYSNRHLALDPNTWQWCLCGNAVNHERSSSMSAEDCVGRTSSSWYSLEIVFYSSKWHRFKGVCDDYYSRYLSPFL
ncbi:hypothetical protein ACHAXS_012848, partial [Conticribra weissflogii]